MRFSDISTKKNKIFVEITRGTKKTSEIPEVKLVREFTVYVRSSLRNAEEGR
jgi:hypothetical protein